MSKFYATTAIDYINAEPHLGHAYEKICADVIARYHRLKGDKVFFLTGTDEHGRKVEKSAVAKNLSPKEFADLLAPKFESAWKKFNISFDRFIRTTEEQHEKTVQKVFDKIYKKRLIYKGKYKGLYCVSCEAFYSEKDLEEGKCRIHKTKCDVLEEETYFFRLSDFQKPLINHIESHKEFIKPEGRRQEILNRLKEPLQDLSISRKTVKWGIPLSNDSSHTIYVWIDALLNYLSGIDFEGKKFKEFWPADVQFVGKDILWFHAVIWPSILSASGIKLPKTIFVHGFVNLAEGKMSKSSGTVVDPLTLFEKYGEDAVRYFLVREIPFGEDGLFSEDALRNRLNLELANDLGNLLNRTISMIERYSNGKIPNSKTDAKLSKLLDLKKYHKHMDSFQLHLALGEAMTFVKSCNKYINEKQPWKLKGKELDSVLYSVADSLRITAILLFPFIPSSSEKIFQQLGLKPQKLNDLVFGKLKSGKIEKGSILFKKVE